MKPQEEFDDLIRRQLQESHSTDWDNPSETTWNVIAGRIRSERRRRWIIWWTLAGLLLLMIATTAVLLVQNRKPPESPVRIQDALIAEEEKDERRTPETQDETIEKRSQRSDNPGSGDNSAGENPAATDSHTPTFTKSPSARSLTSTEDKRDISKSRTPNDVSGAEAESPIQLVKAYPEKDPESDPGIDIAVPGTKENSPLLSSTIDEASTLEISEQRNDASLAMLMHEMNALPDESRLPDLHESAPMIERAARQRWMISGSLTPTFGTRRIAVPDKQPRVRRNLLLQQEEPAIQLGGGISVMRDMGRQWMLGIGIDYTRFLMNSHASHQIRYTRAGEMLNGRGNYENRFNLRLNTSYGQINTDVVVERSSDAMLEEHRFLNLELQTRHSMEVLRFPLTIGYRVPAGKWSVVCGGGISANVLLENQFSFRAIHVLDSEVVGARTLRAVDIEGSMDFALGYQASLGIEIPVSRRLSFLVTPSVSGYLQPVYQDRHVLIYPFSVETDLGMVYKF